MMIVTSAKVRPLVLVFVLALGSVLPATAQHPGRHDARALAEDPRLAEGQLAPVLEGLGNHHRPVTTGSERAQLFFDQGLKLTYGFNHQEALRAFKEAARLDSDCAMAYWGWALVLGPNLNLPMRPEVVEQAREAIESAMSKRHGASSLERELIEALAARYGESPEADRSSLDLAYAEAMRRVYERHPGDDDVATLYAAALMNLSPWNYWTADGRPRERTPEILRILEEVMERSPDHIGALHYYIHAVEPVDPRRGEVAADRLRGLAPGAGHLVHMPSHIFMQTGRYGDAFAVNVLAVQADEDYITQCRAQGIYPLNYYPHNLHFLAWAALMQGRRDAALESAREVAAGVPEDLHGNDWALYQTFLSMPLFTMVRFGMWDEILAEPQPPEDATYWRGIWHHARGLAFLRQGNGERARLEAEALGALAENPAASEMMIGFSHAGRLLEIARLVLEGEMEAAEGRYDRAIGLLDRAVRLQDGLLYTEPPDWYYPVRHTLGAVLLEAGRPEEAQAVYVQDLRRHPDNGWSLYGLQRSLEARGLAVEAAGVEDRFRAAWSDADVELTASRF